MISNRQGGRRRGRGGGGRAPNIGPSGGNRQDNRQRGNAAQLLEKYRGLARDAQMQGDRVQTEYFLQYADHYYRLLNENRARFEEQRRQRGEGYDASEEEEEQLEPGVAAGAAAETAEAGDEADQPRRAEYERSEASRGNGEFRSRRQRGRRDERADEEADDERIAADSLPPAIAAASEEDEEPARAPRRRPRRPRDSDEGIAPAA